MMPYPFQQDIVELCSGQWTEEVSLYVSHINQGPMRQLYLYDNHRATMVKEIAHIHFTDLTHLDLGGNRIESIEALARVQMAHIEFMVLASNNITSVGVIRKAVWPRLQQLYIENNHCKDASTLVHGWLPHMQTLSVYAIWGNRKNRFIELCFPVKMQTASLQHLWILKDRFCFDRSLKRVLQEKWQNILIH